MYRTPEMLASDLARKSLEIVSPYDWTRQRRSSSVAMGQHTFNSVQTFDIKGKPNDSRNDNND